MPSNDTRYNTAAEDIFKHTAMNDDWPDEWIFADARFNLIQSSDKEFLNFLCLTVHPVVREGGEIIITLLEIYNNNLKRDGLSIVKVDEIANRPLFAPAKLHNPHGGSQAVEMPDAEIEVRKALVIGCSSYEHSTRLINPLNDANQMEWMLRTLGFEVVKKIDPSLKEMKLAIDEFGMGLKNTNVGLFYFAGHGVQVKGLNYLIPIDANLVAEHIVEYDCVEATRMLSHMSKGGTSVNIIVLDACRNNPFERNWGRGIHERGLASMSAPKGSLIAYSTSPGNTASDGAGTNGLYTEALLNNINGKGSPINTMFQKVRLEVMEKSNENQVPWEATSLTADFFFNR